MPSSFLFRCDPHPSPSLGPSFSFLRGDRYPRLYYKYTCNSDEGASPLAGRRTQHTSTVLTCARYLPTQPCVRCTVTCIVYGRYHVCLRTNPVRSLRLISFSFVLPWLAYLRLPSVLLCLLALASPGAVRGIKYNKDIQWELIGYLRIYRPLWLHCCARSRDGARSTASLFFSFQLVFLLFRLLLLLCPFFVFHLFAGGAAGSDGDIPQRHNIEARF